MNSEATLEAFREIPDRMLWKEVALAQIEQFQVFAKALGFPWEAVGHHTSKSIQLPVICISCKDMTVYLRDNFHDINICVVASQPIMTPLSVLFEGVLPALSWEWYLEQVAKCRGYSWKDWTDEQMDTPGLLKLTNDTPWYMAKKPEEKTRWAKRMTDPEWYRDWSHGKIVWEGEFGSGVTMWVQDRPFMQGISNLVPSSAAQPYKPGCLSFALALRDLDHAGNLIKNLTTCLPLENKS